MEQTNATSVDTPATNAKPVDPPVYFLVTDAHQEQSACSGVLDKKTGCLIPSPIKFLYFIQDNMDRLDKPENASLSFHEPSASVIVTMNGSSIGKLTMEHGISDACAVWKLLGGDNQLVYYPNTRVLKNRLFRFKTLAQAFVDEHRAWYSQPMIQPVPLEDTAMNLEAPV